MINLKVKDKETGVVYPLDMINFKLNYLGVEKDNTLHLYECDEVDIIAGGDTSDGYHTFNELYYHRMTLFAIICNIYKEHAWKSKLHHDGTMFKDYFIVGITVPGEGDFSYHYHIKDWDLFNVKELEQAPVFDGHTSDDIIRLLKLPLINGSSEVIGE